MSIWDIPAEQRITFGEVATLLIEREIQPNVIHTSRLYYALPSLDAWLKPIFALDWELTKKLLKIDAFIPAANECADFARVCAGYANLLHANTAGRPPESGLAFGEFWFTKQVSGMSGGHAVNVFLHRLNGKPTLGFFEPQNSEVIDLTAGEISSAHFVRI